VGDLSTFNFLSLASNSRYYLYVEKNKHKKDYQQIIICQEDVTHIHMSSRSPVMWKVEK
jgi:hypothetical protein